MVGGEFIHDLHGMQGDVHLHKCGMVQLRMARCDCGGEGEEEMDGNVGIVLYECGYVLRCEECPYWWYSVIGERLFLFIFLWIICSMMMMIASEGIDAFLTTVEQ